MKCIIVCMQYVHVHVYTTTCSSDLIECHLQIVVHIFVPHVVHDIAGDTSPRKHIHLHMRGGGGRRRGRRGKRREEEGEEGEEEGGGGEGGRGGGREEGGGGGGGRKGGKDSVIAQSLFCQLPLTSFSLHLLRQASLPITSWNTASSSSA